MAWYVQWDRRNRKHNKSLVRSWLVQVQEQLDPQYFLSSFQTPDGSWHYTHLRDTVLGMPPGGFDKAVDQKLKTCKPYVCVPVPGQSAWAKPKSQQTPVSSLDDSGLRTHDMHAASKTHTAAGSLRRASSGISLSMCACKGMWCLHILIAICLLDAEQSNLCFVLSRGQNCKACARGSHKSRCK